MRPRGWGWAVGVTAALLLAGGLYSAGGAGESRGPAAVPNPQAIAPTVRHVGGVTRIVTTEPAERLVPDTAPPTVDVTLLWLQGQGTFPTRLGAVALDAAAAPIRFDRRLRAQRVRWSLGTREPASMAEAGDGSMWIATREGSLLHVDPADGITDSAVPAFEYSHVVADARGRIWAVRSPEQFAFPFRFEPEPLLQPVDHADSVRVPARRPYNPIFLHLVNAGRAVFADDGDVFFAPFIRDEVMRLDPSGDTVWIASRGLGHGVQEPTLALDERREPVLDYAPVNLGLAWGPDGMLYVLSTPDTSTLVARLDVFDPLSGAVVRTGALPTSVPTIAVDRAGRVYLLDPFWLLTGVAPPDREPLPPFDLERMGGGRIRLAEARGRVLLVNFWASWCHPCRDEMPALDALAASFAGEPFGFVALSDDVQSEKAAAFIDEFGFAFPVGFGRGTLRQKYHYLGLPYTVLVDGEGRIVQRWSGFAGDGQVAAIRNAIRLELDRMTDGSSAHSAHHH